MNLFEVKTKNCHPITYGMLNYVIGEWGQKEMCYGDDMSYGGLGILIEDMSMNYRCDKKIWLYGEENCHLGIFQLRWYFFN
jgi:hypothetical protein